MALGSQAPGVAPAAATPFMPRFSTQPPERLQHRQIGFARAKVLNALPTPYPYLSIVTSLLQKRFHQCGLANARLARDEDDLPRAA